MNPLTKKATGIDCAQRSRDLLMSLRDEDEQMTTARTITPTAAPIPTRIRARRLMVETPTTVVQPVAPVRAVQVETTADDAMLALAREYFTANKRKNAADREADHAKKALHKQMLEGGVKDFRTVVPLDDGSTALVECKIEAPTNEVISVEKLRTLVDDETFMKIVSATKKDVTTYAGTNVVVAASVTVVGKEDLKIREVRP